MSKSIKEFQIMITIGDSTLIDSTNKKGQVDEWVKAFHDQNVPSSVLKVFQRDEIGGYKLVHSVEVPSAQPAERLIGFGRW